MKAKAKLKPQSRKAPRKSKRATSLKPLTAPRSKTKPILGRRPPRKRAGKLADSSSAAAPPIACLTVTSSMRQVLAQMGGNVSEEERDVIAESISRGDLALGLIIRIRACEAAATSPLREARDIALAALKFREQERKLGAETGQNELLSDERYKAGLIALARGSQR